MSLTICWHRNKLGRRLDEMEKEWTEEEVLFPCCDRCGEEVKEVGALCSRCLDELGWEK